MCILSDVRCKIRDTPPAAQPAPVQEPEQGTKALVSAAGIALEVLEKHRQMKGDYPMGMLGVRAAEELREAFRLLYQTADREPPAATRPATREEKIVNPGVYEVKVEHEPFVWLEDDEGNKYEMPEANKGPLLKRAEEVFESAKKRQWVGLTDEEFIDLCEDASNFGTGSLIRHIEQRLKEKNT
jgi:hypothetical protein